MLEHWKKRPREVVDFPSLEAYKIRLDRPLSNLQPVVEDVLFIAGALDYTIFKCPFQIILFYHSINILSNIGVTQISVVLINSKVNQKGKAWP